MPFRHYYIIHAPSSTLHGRTEHILVDHPDVLCVLFFRRTRPDYQRSTPRLPQGWLDHASITLDSSLLLWRDIPNDTLVRTSTAFWAVVPIVCALNSGVFPRRRILLCVRALFFHAVVNTEDSSRFFVFQRRTYPSFSVVPAVTFPLRQFMSVHV